MSEAKNLRFYVGQTNNLENRMIRHNSGHNKSTKAFRPWRFFFAEKFQSREEARMREKYLKSGVGKEFIKKFWSGSSVG
ncbi:MAG: GIY-YIG nuclease family protein [Chitinophagales bacterium]|nr:GIY-YIG nuclease family protein [Chitinophagales bacterium]